MPLNTSEASVRSSIYQKINESSKSIFRNSWCFQSKVHNPLEIRKKSKDKQHLFESTFDVLDNSIHINAEKDPKNYNVIMAELQK